LQKNSDLNYIKRQVCKGLIIQEEQDTEYMTLSTRNSRGFTLAELLITVAIIGVLVAISIPVFASQMEKSREATDLSNVRAAYAEVMAEAITGNMEYQKKVVPLKQKQDDWQSADSVTIGGITHAKGEEDTDHWRGTPGAGGTCTVSFDPKKGILFDWTGGSGDGNESGPAIDFKENIHEIVEATDLLTQHQTPMFEMDSKSPNSVMVPKVKEKLGTNSLLKYGTWAYLGDTREKYKSTYLFWTSVNTDEVGPGKKIPVIVSKEGGGFYISETTTADRTQGKQTYTAIADHIPNYTGFRQYTEGTRYETLEDAYKAYAKLLTTEEKYSKYKDTLPK